MKKNHPLICLTRSRSISCRSQCKTKKFLDYISNDDLDLVFGDTDYPNDMFNIDRQSKDINVNKRFGLSLVNICCENDKHMLMGDCMMS